VTTDSQNLAESDAAHSGAELEPLAPEMSDAERAEALRYSRILLRLSLLDLATDFVYLGLMAAVVV
jgi:hypothetical protein